MYKDRYVRIVPNTPTVRPTSWLCVKHMCVCVVGSFCSNITRTMLIATLVQYEHRAPANCTSVVCVSWLLNTCTRRRLESIVVMAVDKITVLVYRISFQRRSLSAWLANVRIAKRDQQQYSYNMQKPHRCSRTYCCCTPCFRIIGR